MAEREDLTGKKAPNFNLPDQDGNKHKLADYKGKKVVLYFYPKAFTQGCTLEAHAFAEAHDKFAEAGAMVVGMSADDIATLKRFSTEECRDKFAVAVADPEIIRGYDVALKREGLPAGLSNRTSYVIAPNGRITFVHSDLDYRDHVSLTLAAVQKISDKAR